MYVRFLHCRISGLLINLVQVTSHSASKEFIDKIPAKDKTHSSYEASG